MGPLTNYEKQFADKYHNVVYSFLHKNKLVVSEYYDVVIFRYLGAVQRYLSTEKLRKYSFTTIAWSAMNSALDHHRKQEKRRINFCPITDTEYIDKKVVYKLDDDSNEVPKQIWLEVASLLTNEQMDLLQKKSDGYTYNEIADEFGITVNSVSSRLSRIRKMVKTVCDFDEVKHLVINNQLL